MQLLKNKKALYVTTALVPLLFSVVWTVPNAMAQVGTSWSPPWDHITSSPNQTCQEGTILLQGWWKKCASYVNDSNGKNKLYAEAKSYYCGDCGQPYSNAIAYVLINQPGDRPNLSVTNGYLQAYTHYGLHRAYGQYCQDDPNMAKYYIEYKVYRNGGQIGTKTLSFGPGSSTGCTTVDVFYSGSSDNYGPGTGTGSATEKVSVQASAIGFYKNAKADFHTSTYFSQDRQLGLYCFNC